MKEIHFTKMHGIGNDYIYIDCFKEKVEDPAYLAKIMSPRRTSVGSDGVYLYARQIQRTLKCVCLTLTAARAKCAATAYAA